jgi:hypothetical protein
MRRTSRGSALVLSLVVAALATGAVMWELHRREAGRPFVCGVLLPRRGTPVDVDGRWTVRASARGSEYRVFAFTLTSMRGGTILAGEDKHIPADAAERAPMAGVEVAMEMSEPAASLAEFGDGSRARTLITDASGVVETEARVGLLGTRVCVTATATFKMAATGDAGARTNTLRYYVR